MSGVARRRRPCVYERSQVRKIGFETRRLGFGETRDESIRSIPTRRLLPAC